MVSSSNWFSIVSLGDVSCLPYMVAIAIFVELLSLIHSISVSVPSVVSIISTLSLISFLIRNPTPPPSRSVLFFPIHWYPVTLTSLFAFRCVSVIAAMWVLCVCSAAVRLISLLLIPRVLIVSNLSLVIAFFAFVRLPLLVLCLLMLGLFLCSSQNHTCLHDCFLPCFVDNIPLGCWLWCVMTSLSLLFVSSWFGLGLRLGLELRLLRLSSWGLEHHVRLPLRKSDNLLRRDLFVWSRFLLGDWLLIGLLCLLVVWEGSRLGDLRVVLLDGLGEVARSGLSEVLAVCVDLDLGFGDGLLGAL